MSHDTKSPRPKAKESHPAILRGEAAAKVMARELRAKHRRWNLPLLSEKNGKIVTSKP